MIRLVSILVLLGACLLGRAQAQSKGFALDRFDPAEHGSDWFVGESLDLRGSPRPSLGLVLDWAHKPLVLYGANGDERAALIENQLYAHVGGTLILWSRVRLAVNLPVALWQAGQDATFGANTIAPSRGTTIGDLRLGLDLRLAGEYGDPITLAVGAQVHLPTGSQAAYTGDGAFRIAPRLMIAGDIAAFAYSLRAAYVYRAQDEDLAGIPMGSEVSFTATAGLRFAGKRLLLGPELWGTTVVNQSGAAFKKATTPFELLFGGHYKLPNWIFGLGVGPGLTRGLGAPALRVLASIAWLPAIEAAPAPEPAPLPKAPADRDHDGILDARDACPDTSGVASDDPSKNGCPPDRDGDGVTDAEDACPDAPGVASDDPSKNGCPADRDGDGIPDAEDACPNTKGPRNSDPSENGCPVDRDGDGIEDRDDACPDAFGEHNEDRSKNGCPAARVEQGQIKILERIEFKTNSAELLEASEPVLQAVQKLLIEHPDIARLSIEGHTDNKGSAQHNQRLSQRRAEAVMQWLVKHAIERARLEAHGFGFEKPLESNDSPEGREHNRRVEFHIQGNDGDSSP